MTEWWTYGLSDFLLFSPYTYRRLFELYNAEVWPAHLAAGAAGLALAVCAGRGGKRAARLAFALLGAAWLAVGWAFLWQRYATINWAAPPMAAAFAVQGVLLLGLAAVGAGPLRVGTAARVLLAFALVGWPLVGIGLGRPWAQAELFGLAPDPTVLATLALLPMPRGAAWLAWLVPLAWCAVSGATLWTMGAPEALLLPLAALVAIRAASARG